MQFFVKLKHISVPFAEKERRQIRKSIKAEYPADNTQYDEASEAVVVASGQE
jgi:hypothetical protein